MSERLTLQDLVDLLSEEQSITKKDAETFLRELVALISETIEDKDFVRIKDLGTFKLTPVSARKSVNVNTGETIEIAAHYRLGFTPDKILREGVNKPFSHFESIELKDDEVQFEEKDAKASVRFEEKKVEPKRAAPKVVEQPKVEVKKEESKPAPVKEEPKVVEVKTPQPQVAELEEPETEVSMADNKVNETLKRTPTVEKLEKEVITASDLETEEELADISSFIIKDIEQVEEKAAPKTAAAPQTIERPPIVQTPKQQPAARKVEQDEDDDYLEYEYILQQQQKKRNTWIMVGVAILVVFGLGIWGYNNYNSEPEVIPYAQDNANVRIVDEDKTAEVVLPDVEDDIDEQPVLPVVEEPKAVTPPAATKPAQGAREVTVEKGQTMRQLGLKYFGSEPFWVYIFEENQDKVKRPDAVFAGMTLIIPAASKYGIDANDEASVAKAKRQELKLFSQFSEK